MLKEIIVTGDPCRPSPQEHNILWLYHLIKTQIKWCSGIEPSILNKGPILNFNSWLDNYKNSYEERPFGIEKGDGSKLYIGFEMTPRILNQIEDDGDFYIDLVLHPIRFMNDLVFGLKTNFKLNSNFLINKIISEEQIFLEASFISAAMAHVPGVESPDGTVILIGQTQFDRSLIVNGKMMSFENFISEIRDACSQSEKVFYKPHPFNLDHESHLFKDWYGMVKGIHFCPNTSIYKLLSEPNIKTIIGLSSSVLCEAKYFNKNVVQLLPAWWDGYHKISAENFLKPIFWHELLAPIHNVVLPPRCVTVPHFHSMLRKFARSSWGYEIIDKQ